MKVFKYLASYLPRLIRMEYMYKVTFYCCYAGCHSLRVSRPSAPLRLPAKWCQNFDSSYNALQRTDLFDFFVWMCSKDLTTCSLSNNGSDGLVQLFITVKMDSLFFCHPVWINVSFLVLKTNTLTDSLKFQSIVN